MAYLLAPTVWLLVLLVLAVWWKKRRKKLLLVTLIIFYLLGNGFLFDEVARWYESDPVKWRLLSEYEAVVVLGGYSSFDPKNNQIEFREASDRLIYGMLLYQQKRANKIIISGGSGSMVGIDKEGSYIYPFLKDMGIKSKDILVDSISQNTYQNAVNVRTILAENNIQEKCLLITSAIHMPRAKSCFEKQGIAVDILPVDRIAGPRKYYFDHLFIPSVETFMNWQRLMHEIVGYLAYKIKGYC